MLKDILTDLAIELGKTSSNEDRNARISRINKAAEEVHEKYDLEEGKDEKVFLFNPDTDANAPQIALPPYVFQVRGMRFHDSRNYISLDSMRNRYNFHFYAENDLWYLRFREKRRSPLSRTLTNRSVLKLSVPIAEDTEFKVTVIGQTENSYRVNETLTFSPGDLEKETEGNFIAVESISKNIITKYNVIVKDVEDNTVGMILNSEYQSTYKIYQIGDSDQFQLPETASAVEVWFKYKLQPLKNDEDCFLGSSRYDKAIFWKFMEHRSKKPEDALAFREKCAEAIATIEVNDKSGEREEIDFKPQPFFEIYDYVAPRRY